MPRLFSLLVVILGIAVVVRPTLAAETVDYQRDIRPLLSDRCILCHGPDTERREADLRLDVKGDAFRASESGDGSHIIVPGEPGKSELYLRITSSDADVRMPPPSSKLALSETEVALIKSWIEQGANWREHWSFSPLEEVAPPHVEDATWLRNPVDNFILARLEADGWKPSARASREKLIRRLTFDLTGLPPTLEEIDAFLVDELPDAYERVVDRLLKSPRYGERMTSDWLDVARYSDTYGYQVDRDRFVWPWRDWVINALNDNLPYDQFITQQLAGDLLPSATDDQILATTFNRLHPQKVEGGSVPEEFRIEYVTDRVQTFATAFLGLTLECARCHDHKYDPLLQTEYYQLCAFFDNIDEAGLYSYFTPAVPTPTLRMADDATKANIAELDKQVAEEEAKLKQLATAKRAAFGEWQVNAKSIVDGGLVPGMLKHLAFDEVAAPNELVPGKVGPGVRLTGDDGIGLDVGNFKRSQPFSVTLWMNTPDVKQRAVVFHRSRAWTDAGSRGYELLLEEGCLSAALIHFWPGNAIRVRTREPIATNQWLHVAITYDGSSRAAGWRIYIDGEPADTEIVRDNLYKEITGGGGDNITIGERFRDRGFTGGLVDEFRVYGRQLSSLEVAQLHDDHSLTDAMAASVKTNRDAATNELYDYYLTTVDQEFQLQLAALQQARDAKTAAEDSLQEIMVMRELPTPRQTYLLKRGAYDAPGDPVSPGTPGVFPPLADGAPNNRLGLAQWLTDPSHPLTARVAVNRFWQIVFGNGLVRTPEDFGRQGQPPSHPELLDWLARDFAEHQWDVKRLMKLLVMSATYQQGSAVTETQLARDPENRLLGRSPSHRLTAEMLRDNALAVSGLLVDRIGGPPARPYEVEVSFKPVDRDKGDGLYRRSLYTYWKRTGPAPAMMTLDASKRDVCRVKRERTASPLQAFVLLNDPQFVEAARMLAARMLKQHGDDANAALVDMFRLLTSRRPRDAEQDVLRSLYDQQLMAFANDVEQASQYLKTGDAPLDDSLDVPRLAALAVVANTLLSFDECVMKR
ncbi:MAG: DUF1553 domain-containing protein [Planctomycetota bacterium]|nr:DUF1553 domain-containing protein [Planctomycetota bacterium]